MKYPIRMLLLFAMILFAFSMMACAASKPVPIPVKPPEVYCPEPEEPVFAILGQQNRYSDRELLVILLTDLNAVMEYTLKLKATVKCYERTSQQ